MRGDVQLPAAKEQRFAFLDGIRGWGAIAVLLYHVFVDGFPVNEQSRNILYRVFLFNGTLAVWIFFVVSGFSLSINFLRTHQASRLRLLFISRYLRLSLPIFAVGLFVYLLYRAGLIVEPLHRPARFQSVLATCPRLGEVFEFSFYKVYFDYRPTQSLDPPLWTMPIELTGSLLVFLALSFLPATTSRRWAFLAVLAAGLIALSPIYGTFAIGLMMAEGFRQFARSESFHWVATAGWIALVIGIGAATELPAGDQRLHLFSAASFCFAFCFNARLRRMFETPLSRYLGKISYSLYLVHAVVFYFLTLRLYRSFGQDVVTKVWVNLATLATALALAHGFTPVDEFARRAAKAAGAWVLGEKPLAARPE